MTDLKYLRQMSQGLNLRICSTEGSYAIEDSERLSDLILGVVLGELPGHEAQEVGEHDVAGGIRVDLVHHVLETSTSRVPHCIKALDCTC